MSESKRRGQCPQGGGGAGSKKILRRWTCPRGHISMLAILDWNEQNEIFLSAREWGRAIFLFWGFVDTVHSILILTWILNIDWLSNSTDSHLEQLDFGICKICHEIFWFRCALPNWVVESYGLQLLIPFSVLHKNNCVFTFFQNLLSTMSHNQIFSMQKGIQISSCCFDNSFPAYIALALLWSCFSLQICISAPKHVD